MIISVTGPESSGKTVLSQKLARRLHGQWVAEYAREYLTRRGSKYGFEDLASIARGQHALLQRARKHGAMPVVMDTDVSVIIIWSQFVYGKLAPPVEKLWAGYRPDIFLLCYPDIPWKPDPLRESPDKAERLELFNRYQNLLAGKDAPVVVIKGGYAQRELLAIEAVKRLK